MKIGAREKIFAASLSLAACTEPPPTLLETAFLDGRRHALQNGNCPVWRDEQGIVPEMRDRAFFDGLYDNKESLEVLDRYMTAFQSACEETLNPSRSHV